MNVLQPLKLSSAAALLVWWSILLYFGSIRAAAPRCQEEIGDSGYCSVCPEGNWGRQCQNTCHSDKCMLNTCDIDTGYCTYGCMDGYFFDESERVCKQCPDRCTKCKSPTNCTECIDGYRGLQCQDTCLFKEYCAKCSRFGCLECVKGMYGRSCLYNCSFCADGCDRLKCIGGCPSGSSWYMYGGPKGYCVLCKTPWCKTCSVWDACETCVDGRWGDICESDCSDNCHGGVCNKTTGECVCKDQYFMDYNSMCQECPNNCATCTSAQNCQTCVEGFYGSRCEHNCDSNCLECSGKASNCTVCKKLYAFNNNRCYPCPEGCRDCYYSSRRGRARCWDRLCLDQEGYYYSKAGDDYAIGREDDICRKCPTGCSFCTSESLCRGCHSGYFPFNSICCPDQCTTCISGTECKTCPKGMYGKLCEKQCSEGCLSCSNGDYCNVCNNGRYSKSSEYTDNQCECSVAECLSSDKDGTCLTCKGPGWHPFGNGCCPCNKYCVNGTCDSKEKCSACSTDTRHGQSCEHDCSTSIPFCKRCTNTSRLECIECETGTYLLNGACITCFSGCVDSECDHNGQCVNGCVDGWTGARCEQKCNANCRKCDRYVEDGSYSAICTECIGGSRPYGSYYGVLCGSACSQNCASGRCYITTGDCHGMCKTGYWGGQCERHCGDGCLGGCHRFDGTCETCDRFRYGRNCSSTCNENCVNPNNTRSPVCRKADGKCLFGCEVGFKGQTCSQASVSSAPEEPTSHVPLIVGVVVGVLVAIAVIIVAILVCRKRRSPDNAYPSRGAGTSSNKTDGPMDPDTEQVPLTSTTTTTTTTVG